MRKKWLSYLLLVSGTALTAAAFGLIILPQEFSAGGVTGASLLLCKLIPLPLSVMVLLLNVCLFILGWIFVGRSFVWKSLLTSLLFPPMLEAFQQLSVFQDLSADPLLSSILAGAVLGLGASLILLGNGSGGGFDILAVVLNRKCSVSVSLVIYLCDLTVILGQAVATSLLQTVYGTLVILVCSLMIHQILTRGKAEGQMLIFSQEYEKIRVELLAHQDVGMTFLSGESGYLRQPVQVILTVMPHDKIETVKRSVQQIDPSAFVLIDNIRYVGGKGYTIAR